MITSDYKDIIDDLIKIRTGYTLADSFNHIACLVSKNNKYNKIIGLNSDKTLFGNKTIKTHAEMAVIKKIRYYFKCNIIKNNKMDLIILRVNKYGKLCNSAPCYHCTCFLETINNKQFIKINRIYYSTTCGNINYIKFNEWVSLQKSNKHISRCWKHWTC